MKLLKKQFKKVVLSRTKYNPLLNPPPQGGGGKKKTPSYILPLRKGEEGRRGKHKPGNKRGGHLETGRLGEEIARKHLEQKGYKIIEQNYKTKYGEIDLIARKGKELIFVEVRTKKGENYGLPEDTINKKKLKKIWLNTKAYMAIKKWRGLSRIDAICVVLKEDNSIKRLDHYENVV
jgi:putative endonuclease